MQEHLLSISIFFPVLGAILLLLIPNDRTSYFRNLAIAVSSIQFIFISIIFLTGEFSEENTVWFSIKGIDNHIFSAGYHVLLDGVSLPLFWLTSLIMLIALVASVKIKKQIKGYYILMLILHSAVSGTFAAADFLLFYVFFEFMLIPMYFLIGIWGSEKREYASLKFFIYTLAGSLLILIAMILLYVSIQQPGNNKFIVHTFDLKALIGMKGLIPGSLLDPASGMVFLGIPMASWVFILLITGFAIKVPIIPFHTWLPDAHVEAPTPVSVILAGLLLKTGGYGILRYACFILPEEHIRYAEWLAIFGVLSIIYAALNALAAKDLKRMIAYSSISHMGFVILGIAAATAMSIQGAIFQMVTHGLISTMLFLLAGSLQDRTSDRTISNYSGLFTKMPIFSSMILVSFFAGMGIPGFASFIGELLVLLGSYKSQAIGKWITITATLGILLSAGYFAWTIQRILFGVFVSKTGIELSDLNFREKTLLYLLSILLLLFGIFPSLLLDLIAPFTENWISPITLIGSK